MMPRRRFEKISTFRGELETLAAGSATLDKEVAEPTGTRQTGHKGFQESMWSNA